MSEDTNDISEVLTSINDRPEQHFGSFSVISLHGRNRLVKASRYGKWFMLKGLKPEYASDVMSLELLHKEFDLLMSINHPSVVRAYGWETIEGYGPCIVMEYVDGITMGQWLKNEGTTKVEKRRLYLELLNAVSYLHQKEIMHRDLKPDNVMVTLVSQRIKIIDFGLSDSTHYQALKQPAGTKGYISPEQKGSVPTDVRNDIYSLGIILQGFALGKGYERVVKKCLSPLNVRFRSVEELKHAFLCSQKRRYRWLWGSCVALALLLSVIVCLYLFNVSSKEELAIKDKCVDSTALNLQMQGMLVPASSSQILSNEPKQIDARTDRMSSPPVTNNAQSSSSVSEQAMISQLKRKCMLMTDSLIQAYGTDVYFDTVNVLDIKELQYRMQAIQKMTALHKTVIQPYRQRLSIDSYSKISMELHNYQQPYFDRWKAKMDALLDKKSN